MAQITKTALTAALVWHIENGADEVLADVPVSAFSAQPAAPLSSVPSSSPAPASVPVPVPVPVLTAPVVESKPDLSKPDLEGATTALRAEAVRRALAAGGRDELRELVAGFEGLAIKKTAMNLVFSDGNPAAAVMVVGEAPGADEDRMGLPFVGASGQLLDKILASIGLSRRADDPRTAAYIANILNWRPPGNRNPTPGEVSVCLPLIERHIMLVKPKILIMAGAVSAQALLGSDQSVSKLRGRWHTYTPRTPELRAAFGVSEPVLAIATYHPAYLLRTPAQKKAVWQDMLMVQDKRRELGLIDSENNKT